MDAPAGVGFSFNFGGNLTYTDTQVAIDNHQALIAFFTNKFPELKNNDFYIAGESYAGTYIPMLAGKLIDDKTNFPNFKGMLVGNGCLNDKLLFNTVIQYSYNHAFIDETYYRNAVAKCCNGKASENCDWYQFSANPNGNCFNESLTLNYANFFTGLDPYFLYFSCYLDQPGGTNSVEDMSYKTQKSYRNTMTNFHAKRFNYPPHVQASLPSCSHHNDAEVYLNRLDVRGAINVPGNVQNYAECSDTIANNYITEYHDMTPFVLKVVQASLKVLFFNGDVDSVCSHVQMLIVGHYKSERDDRGVVEVLISRATTL
uniref:Carboxypeptidase n=1 Tax=Acrobeloides nanus TaxID=290746 RepID=A0A914C4Z9_9BILA